MDHIASPKDYLQAAQQAVETENLLRNQAQQLFDVANEMRKRQTDESLPFEEKILGDYPDRRGQRTSKGSP